MTRPVSGTIVVGTRIPQEGCGDRKPHPSASFGPEGHEVYFYQQSCYPQSI